MRLSKRKSHQKRKTVIQRSFLLTLIKYIPVKLLHCPPTLKTSPNVQAYKMLREYFLDLGLKLCNIYKILERSVATVTTRLWQTRQWVNATSGRRLDGVERNAAGEADLYLLVYFHFIDSPPKQHRFGGDAFA